MATCIVHVDLHTLAVSIASMKKKQKTQAMPIEEALNKSSAMDLWI